MRHPLEEMLNADAEDILSAIQAGARAIVDVKGKLAEYFLDKELKRLKEKGVIEDYFWSDKDGQPDFNITHKGRQLKMECKNVRSKELYRDRRAYKVEIQKTRNSKDGTNTRGYRINEFDVLGACLFNHMKKWEYLFVCTRNLERRPEDQEFLKIMQPVPFQAAGAWKSELVQVLDESLKH